MSEFKGTSGPWMAASKPSSVVGWPVVGLGGRLVADIALGHKPPHISDGEWSAHYVEVDANARLISAAPELLSVAQRLASWDHCWPGNINLESVAKDARAAIAKALGEGQ